MIITFQGIFKSYRYALENIKMFFRKRKLNQIYSSKTDLKALAQFAYPSFLLGGIGKLEYKALEKDFIVKKDAIEGLED